MKKEDYDNYEPPIKHSSPAWPKERSRPSRDSGKGRGTSSKGGRSLENLIPCDQCMALFVTNSSCDWCKKEGQTNLVKLRSAPKFAHLQMHKQPKLNVLSVHCLLPNVRICTHLTLLFSYVVMNEQCLMYSTRIPRPTRQLFKTPSQICKTKHSL